MKSADFSRNRTLTFEHVFGLTLSMSAARNGNGYAISSQNYFCELSEQLGRSIDPVCRQSVAEARGKIRWQAFEYLLDCANLESTKLPSSLRFHGHVTRAIDGTSFTTPRSAELLQTFTPRRTRAEEKTTHYPYGLLVTAINVFTGQPVRAVVDNYRTSERELLVRMMAGFNPGDLALLDRGLGGKTVYLEFQARGQFFLHRGHTGTSSPNYIRAFLASGRREQEILLTVPASREEPGGQMHLRLIRGPDDTEGSPLVFVTNLLDAKKYPIEDVIGLYQKRWSVETLYHRMKNLVTFEQFHARTHNGVMQEIYASLMILSLTALAITAVVEADGLKPSGELPGFKNAFECVRRNLFTIVDQKITGTNPRRLMRKVLNEVRAVIYPIRPGRSFARVSRQPIQQWNLKKSAKIKAFKLQQAKLNATGVGKP